jgi:diguanylate cyclase (GGDEF)-like protein
MELWEGLHLLRAGYLRESAAKLDKLAEGIALLPSAPDGDALMDLRRRFHAFAGSGPTYGYPQAGALAVEGEALCATLHKEGRNPTLAESERLQGLVDAMRKEFPTAVPELDAPPPASLKPASRPVRILIVEGDKDHQERLGRLVTQEGMEPHAVGTDDEARRAIAECLPDGMITSVHLPDGSGYGLVEYLRGRPGGEQPVVLMIGALGHFLDKVDAIHCGADGYFEKPVDWEGLTRRLVNMLDAQKQAPVRVLCVEDDPPQGALLQAVLESVGYEVLICRDPARFETDLIGFVPDLVIMDILLPGVSGYDLVRYLRQDERYATLPALFLTTERELHARIQSARAGGDDYLIKPVSGGLLLSTVAARAQRGRLVKSLLDRDGLTQLLTHTAFLDRARSAVSLRSRNPESTCAWIMLDLDTFKSINDRYGHAVGDRVLAAVSTLLRQRLRQSDTIGRYGGEEFAILISDLDESQVVRLVSRVLEEFSQQDREAPDGSVFRATFSAGVAMLDPATMDLERWRQAADDALYRAKASGRCRVVAARPPGESATAARGPKDSALSRPAAAVRLSSDGDASPRGPAAGRRSERTGRQRAADRSGALERRHVPRRT